MKQVNHALDSSREADDGEEEGVHVEVLKHALNGVAINPEGDTGHAQVKATADHVISSQSVCVRRGHLAWDST